MHKFTQKEAKEMYDALAEIRDALSDKKSNVGSILKLSSYEAAWLLGIGSLLKRINK